MGEEDRWAKVREIVREECARIRDDILAVIEKHGETPNKNRVSFVNGEWVGITDQLLRAWSTAYPAVDIKSEMNKAAAWILSNPNDAPRRQFSKFLLTWFSRTQDRSAIRSIPTRSEQLNFGPGKKLCAYCERVAIGSVNQTWYCNDHSRNAMDRDPIPHMRGIEPKAVAGRD